MKKRVLGLALLATVTSSFALASVGDELRAGPTEMYQITKVICADGQLAKQTNVLIGAKTNSLMLADGDGFGKVLAKAGDSIVMVSEVSGEVGGLCSNSGQPTSFIEVFKKVSQ